MWKLITGILTSSLAIVAVTKICLWVIYYPDNWFKSVKRLADEAIEIQQPVYFKLLHKKYKIICDESLQTELDINWRPKILTDTFNSLLPDSFFIQNFKKYPQLRDEKRILVKTLSSPEENFDTILYLIQKHTVSGNIDMLSWTNNILYSAIGKIVMGISIIPQDLKIAEVVHQVSLMANEIMKNNFLWSLPHKQLEIYKLRQNVINTTKKLFKLNDGLIDENKYTYQMAKYYNTNIYNSKIINKTGVAVFLAAENTISLILYCYWKLLTNNNVYEKLKDTLTDELTYESVSNNKYLEAIINETLRYYPLVPMVLRQNKKGEIIIVPIMDIHHSKKFYAEPESFRPEHFSDEESKNRPSHAFIPFGWGSRSCSGRNIGKLIAKTVISYLVKNVDATMNTSPKLYNDILNKIENGWIVDMKLKVN